MLSAHLLLVCVAVAAAGPLPSKPKLYVPKTTTTAAPATTTAAPATTTAAPATTTAAPAGSKPDLRIKISSQQTHVGNTKGGASVSTTGSTQGSGSNGVEIAGTNFVLNKIAAGSAGASAASASSGNGAFEQGADAVTEVASIGARHAQVTTASQGVGTTNGTSSSVQKVVANARFSGVLLTALGPKGGIIPLQIQVDKKAGATSSSSHEASTRGFGTFDVNNLAGTDIKRHVPASLPKPRKGLSTDSRLKQNGKTTGSGALSAASSSQGSASGKAGLQTPIIKVQQAVAANSGVAGTGLSSGNGIFKQDSQSKTELASSKDGIRVKTGTHGNGLTFGTSGSAQKAAANGGATEKKVVIVTLSNGKQVVRIVDKKNASGTSSTGHKASNTGAGKFNTTNVAQTEIKLNVPKIKLPVPEIPTPAPVPVTTTQAPTIKGKKF